MHRAILGASLGEEVDHRDGDGLNNIRRNLRACTHGRNTQNQRRPVHNTSGFKGVSQKGNRWRAYIKFNGVQHHLGTYDSAIHAAKVYDRSAQRLFGHFSRLNFPK